MSKAKISLLFVLLVVGLAFGALHAPIARVPTRVFATENSQGEDPTVTWAYVASSGGYVFVIDAETCGLLKTIDVGAEYLLDVAITPDGNFAYVSVDPIGSEVGSLVEIRTSDNTVIGEITDVPSPRGMDILHAPDGDYIYMASYETDEVTIVRLSDKNTETVSVGDGPTDVVVTPNGEYVYVANSNDNTVSVIQTSDNTIAGSPVSVGIEPLNLVMHPNGSFVYVACYGRMMGPTFGGVYVIGTSSNTVVDVVTIYGYGTRGIDITPNGEYVYVANREYHEVNVIRTLDNVEVMEKRVTLPDDAEPRWIAITPDGKHAYVTLHTTAQVAIIRIEDDELIDLMDVGPLGVPLSAVAPTGADIAEIPRSLELRIAETPITTSTECQWRPDIYGDIIVWEDDRSGWNVYMYDLFGGLETPISLSVGSEGSPAVYDKKIVWEDFRSPAFNYDIYMYDLATGTETPICTDPAPQNAPAIYGNAIVWEDLRSTLDIYMYDLLTSTEIQVTTDPGQQWKAAIYDDLIVWEDCRGPDFFFDIYMYDLSTGIETPITTDSAFQTYPDIYGDIIVWMDERNDNFDIYMYDLATGTETPICTDPAYQGFPTIYGNFIVWMDERNGLSDIYMYDLSTGLETPVCTAAGMQTDPVVYGNRIVWADSRNGNWDIYIAEISFVPKLLPDEQAESIKDVIRDPSEIPTSDFYGATDGARENRRTALLNRLDAVTNDIQTAEESEDPTIINSAYQSALDQLNSILDKTDGCSERGTPDIKGSGYTVDWIITCESQAKIDLLIRILIASLEALLIP